MSEYQSQLKFSFVQYVNLLLLQNLNSMRQSLLPLTYANVIQMQHAAMHSVAVTESRIYSLEIFLEGCISLDRVFKLLIT